MPSVLQDLVPRKIREIGEKDASEFFGVSLQLIRQWVKGSKKISLSAVEKVFREEDFVRPPKIEVANWGGKQVSLLLPFYRTVQPQTVLAITSILDRAKMDVLMHWGDAFIIHTRNELATSYVKSGVPLSFWLDDDMIPPFGDGPKFNRVTGFNFPESFAGQHVINRLMSHGKSLVGALYFSRTRQSRPLFGGAFRNAEKTAMANAAPHDRIEPVPWVATGSLLVAREVYLDIQKTFPELAPQIGGTETHDHWHFFSNSETDLTRGVGEALAVLADESVTAEARAKEAARILDLAKKKSVSESRLKQGEDITFCKRAAAAGHQPYVDLGCVCGHVGNKVYGPKGRFA